MKVRVVLAVAVVLLWASSISMVEPQSTIGAIKNDEHKLAVAGNTVKFNTASATRKSYMMFMQVLRQLLLQHGDTFHGIAILPPPTMAIGTQRYVMVELTNGERTVTLALDVTNVYVLGYHASTSGTSYFFSDVAPAVQNISFPDTERGALAFDSSYGALERAAGRGRRGIPLGFGRLRDSIRDLGRLQPTTGNNYQLIAEALLVCVQMVSEPARFRNIEQQLAEVAERGQGGYADMYPDDLMMLYQTSWSRISTSVQTATNGVFTEPIQFASNLVYDNVASVTFIVALMLERCTVVQQFLQKPEASISSSSSLPMRSTGLEDGTCDRVLAPISHITGQNGLCVDVFDGYFDDGNKIILYPCGENQVNQVWTLRSQDNTIRAGGKCLTTYGYASGNYVMIFDCRTAVRDATIWEIRSDGQIRNPRSGLVLTGRTDSSGVINLVVDKNMNASNQAFYVSNNTRPLMTTIVGYNGLCLMASGNGVWLEKCIGNNAEQQWSIYPDGTIRPQWNLNECLKHGNIGGDAVYLGRCDGYIQERWRFQNDGTILHVATGLVMDVKYLNARVHEITVKDYNEQQLSQVWFQV